MLPGGVDAEDRHPDEQRQHQPHHADDEVLREVGRDPGPRVQRRGTKSAKRSAVTQLQVVDR
jgi:hypothetical protein